MTTPVDAEHQLVVEVFVRELARSVAFYQALGFDVVRQSNGFAVLRWDRALLFLDEQADLPPLSGHERANVRVMVPDVDAMWRRVASIDAVVSAEIADRSYGLRDFTVRDPDGFGVRFATRLPS